jgi:uncharacterized protein YyaL (SSP411 family)
VEQLERSWDRQHAGWGQGSKFPNTPSLELYLARAALHDDPLAEERAKQLLDAMARGGLHDHLGGGFHRYTVDPAWMVPHFEKMTYDNGQLLRAYATAALLFDEPRYADVARRTARWLLEDMRHDDGTFYSSIDADSPGGEGAYYVWTPAQVQEALQAEQAQDFLSAYGVTKQGNFEHGQTVLSLRGSDLPEAREAPATDTKRVVAYNALVIGGLARAGRLLGEPSFVEAASKAATSVLAARSSDGGLPRTLAQDAPHGVIDDYAYLAEALLDLHEATAELPWLAAADEVAQAMMKRFLDPVSGGFFYSDARADDLLVRRIDFTDGVRPAGAGRALAVLWRLRAYGAPAGDGEVLQRGLQAAGRVLERTPAAAPSAALVAENVERGGMEVVLSTSDRSALGPWLAAFNGRVRPDAVLAVTEGGTEPYGALRGKLAGAPVRAYVCFDGVCEQPTEDLDAYRARLDGPRPQAARR